MWANNLTGEIPEGICINGGNLETLILNNNLISGTIPRSIVNCTNMIWVSLSSNRLSGDIPSGIGNLHKLAILQLGNNSLSGQIPAELGKCEKLIWLDLNSNELGGSIPPELSNQAGLVLPGIVSGKHFAFRSRPSCSSSSGSPSSSSLTKEVSSVAPTKPISFPVEPKLETASDHDKLMDLNESAVGNGGFTSMLSSQGPPEPGFLALGEFGYGFGYGYGLGLGQGLDEVGTFVYDGDGRGVLAFPKEGDFANINHNNGGAVSGGSVGRNT
ncbi:hypothetical protein C1H46_005243 [Malus baccata]|uniref:Leucine-rich repeat-containing N-terminal plant-type domain-containing protein n=1 Tax=Malus baccata TaxID=106549 RepID=A0A540NEY9_MALBA|nr:hypothetical protein C1H46_005243 [Malus baccata]